MGVNMSLQATNLIDAIDNLNAVFQLQNASSESQQRELVNVLPDRIRQEIFFNIWDQANRPPEDNYGQNHAFDNLNKLKMATQGIVAECLKTTASCLQAIPKTELDQIYFKVWHEAGEPPVANYGEQHALDNPTSLQKIIHDVLNSLQVRSASEPSTSSLPQAPISAAISTPIDPNSPSEQIRARAQALGFIIFYDEKTDPLTGGFGNFHPCLVPYHGKLFGNAEAAFQSQKYIDQPEIYNLFNDQTTGDQAVSLSKQHRMTAVRLSQWDSQSSGNKIDVMTSVLRVKFETNPPLKEILMATGSAYLCEHLPDAYRSDTCWSDGFNGTGGNELGKALMRLRGEFGGTGIVASPWGNLNGPRNYSYASNSLHSLVTPTLTAPTPQPLIATREVCILPSCNKPRYEGHQFCTITHARLYNDPKNCDNCHERPKFVETSGRIHNYCGRSCAQLAQQKK